MMIFLAVSTLVLVFFYNSLVPPHIVEQELDALGPLTTDVFVQAFNLYSVRHSMIGEYLHRCELLDISAEPKYFDGKTYIHRVGTVRVIESTPPTWMDVYYDDVSGNSCYRIYAHEMKSWLICPGNHKMLKLMSEISNMCWRYTDSLKYAMPFF